MSRIMGNDSELFGCGWADLSFLSKSAEKTEKESGCSCGRTVCCGKHKDCCHKKETIRFVKGAQRER